MRQSNEDAVFAMVSPSENGNVLGLLIVADGMGGHQAGEIASRLSVDTIYDELKDLLEPRAHEGEHIPARHIKERLCLAIRQANTTIYNYAREHPTDAGNLGSTVTCAVMQGKLAVIANVGDSRTYHLGTNGLEQVTDDHSYVGELVRGGRLPAEAIYEHPQRGIVTRALGPRREVEIDVCARALSPGDRLLLCSDGLWEMVHDEDRIARVLREADRPDTAVQQLIEAANQEGGTDNISVVVGEISST
jgi:serine/threonine protein phosphatase PrpC